MTEPILEIDELTGRQTLRGDEAIKLWKQGRDVWNKWADEVGECDVDFSRVDFYEHRIVDAIPADKWPFAGFSIPNGTVNFERARFGEGNVDFRNAQFGDGDVFFGNAQFGNGTAFFIGVQFGKGEVSFNRAIFGTGNKFFVESNFGEGNLRFTDVQFGHGDAFFDNAVFGAGRVWFDRSAFDGLANFLNISNVCNATRFSFQHCSFKRALVLSSNEPFNCVPDLRQTKTEHHVSLDGLKIKPRKKLVKRFGFIWVETASDEEDADRLIRLKQLAQDNKDHDAALEFLALEQRAKRWVRMGNFMSLVDIAYSGVSDYGRSVGRPLALLMMLCFGFAYGYDVLSRPAGVAPYQHVSAWFDERGADALVYSATGTIPLVPAARKAAVESYEKLQIETSENRVTISFLTMLQGVLSTILLFLIGLALRNRFRV